MLIKKCRTYHARLVNQNVLHMSDGKSVFKIYYLSIMGREKPEDYEWEYCPLSQDSLEKMILAGKHEGIGFITSFPHITKIFRFSPHGETVLDISEYHTHNMQPMDFSRGDGTHEFACFAESVISAEEYQAWASAKTVEEFIAFRCKSTDFPVVSHTKLASYWGQG